MDNTTKLPAMFTRNPGKCPGMGRIFFVDANIGTPCSRPNFTSRFIKTLIIIAHKSERQLPDRFKKYSFPCTKTLITLWHLPGSTPKKQSGWLRIKMLNVLSIASFKSTWEHLDSKLKYPNCMFCLLVKRIFLQPVNFAIKSLVVRAAPSVTRFRLGHQIHKVIFHRFVAVGWNHQQLIHFIYDSLGSLLKKCAIKELVGISTHQRLTWLMLCRKVLCRNISNSSSGLSRRLKEFCCLLWPPIWYASPEWNSCELDPWEITSECSAAIQRVK